MKTYVGIQCQDTPAFEQWLNAREAEGYVLVNVGMIDLEGYPYWWGLMKLA